MRPIDLRSDTLTTPTPAMRRAMAEAEVGDDVYGEDPTVNRLEEEAAALLGKEAALFVPSGTMGNQIALLLHTHRGDEVWLEAESHIYWYEVGGLGSLAHVQPRLIFGRNGKFGPQDLEALREPPDIHRPRPRLLCLENTHNRAGGVVWTVGEVEEVAAAARRLGLAFHLDGARLFNAAVALKVKPSVLAAPFDTVMVSLSKGLAAPVGSLLLGSRDQIGEARRWRKLLGGGMRQAGILAAAGLIGLREMVERLEEDHLHARILAEEMATWPGLNVDLSLVQTNIVKVTVAREDLDGPALSARFHEAGVKVSALGPRFIRLVTHKDVSRRDVEEALRRMKEAYRA
ncbi:MAG: GntG family PLP-dependent aldolase [Bacillota bacterium]|nr:GntG family PLP-dependent aldolase [Bacillota bacterium]